MRSFASSADNHVDIHDTDFSDALLWSDCPEELYLQRILNEKMSVATETVEHGNDSLMDDSNDGNEMVANNIPGQLRKWTDWAPIAGSKTTEGGDSPAATHVSAIRPREIHFIGNDEDASSLATSASFPNIVRIGDGAQTIEIDRAGMSTLSGDTGLQRIPEMIVEVGGEMTVEMEQTGVSSLSVDTGIRKIQPQADYTQIWIPAEDVTYARPGDVYIPEREAKTNPAITPSTHHSSTENFADSETEDQHEKCCGFIRRAAKHRMFRWIVNAALILLVMFVALSAVAMIKSTMFNNQESLRGGNQLEGPIGGERQPGFTAPPRTGQDSPPTNQSPIATSVPSVQNMESSSPTTPRPQQPYLTSPPTNSPSHLNTEPGRPSNTPAGEGMDNNDHEVPSEKPSEPPTQLILTLPPTISPISIPTSKPTSPPTFTPTSPPASTPTSLPTFTPTPAPTSPPTLTPTSLPTSIPALDFPGGADAVAARNRILEIIIEASPGSLDLITENSSPQYQALVWMTDDLLQQPLSDYRILQRWVLAVLFISTRGDAWINSNGWMTPQNECEWFTTSSDDICDSSGAITRIELSENNLGGTIPGEIALLSNSLVRLFLNSNLLLSGTLPRSFGLLTNLERLHLTVNRIRGPIPMEFGSMTGLTYLALGRNDITGTLPLTLGSLTRLRSLDLALNFITGSIPTELGALTRLTRASFTSNQLVGTVPEELGNLMQLTELKLRDNRLSGSMPSEICSITTLKILEVGCSEISCSCCNNCR